MKRSWEFYSKRKRLTLEDFLLGVTSLESALAKFDLCQVMPPEDLHAFYEEKAKVLLPPPEPSIENEVSKKKTTRRRRTSTQNKSTPKKSTKKEDTKEYFRKVIKKDR